MEENFLNLMKGEYRTHSQHHAYLEQDWRLSPQAQDVSHPDSPDETSAAWQDQGEARGRQGENTTAPFTDNI